MKSLRSKRSIVLCIIFQVLLFIGQTLFSKPNFAPPLKAIVQLRNAKVYLRTGQLERALIRLNKVLSLYPDFAEALHARGIVRFKQEFYEETCRDWKLACELDTAWCQGKEFSGARKICP